MSLFVCCLRKQSLLHGVQRYNDSEGVSVSMLTSSAYVRGNKKFWNLNLPRKQDVFQGSARRYCKPTTFWTSLLSDIALRASCHFFLALFLSVCKFVWRFLLKFKWLILKSACENFVSLWERKKMKLLQCSRKLLRIKPCVKHKRRSRLIISK